MSSPAACLTSSFAGTSQSTKCYANLLYFNSLILLFETCFHLLKLFELSFQLCNLSLQACLSRYYYLHSKKCFFTEFMIISHRPQMSWGDLPTKPNFLAAISGFTKSQVRFVQGPNVVMFPQMKTLMPSRPDLKIWHSAHIAGSHTLPESKQNTTRASFIRFSLNYLHTSPLTNTKIIEVSENT